MEASLLTFAFDPEKRRFPGEELEDFCMNKNIIQMESHFFQHEACPYWTVFIRYERLVKVSEKVPALAPAEQALYERLRIWRKEKAEQKGFPAYLIATNRQLIEMIHRKVRSQTGFAGIKGFGRKRIQQYGQEIIQLIQTFYAHEKT